jgi:hypothetical protein
MLAGRCLVVCGGRPEIVSIRLPIEKLLLLVIPRLFHKSRNIKPKSFFHILARAPLPSTVTDGTATCRKFILPPMMFTTRVS